MSGRLEGKIALITGAGTGIGRGIARAFAREGAKVALLGRRRRPLLKVQREVEATGGEARALRADVAAERDARRAVESVLDAWGGLDVLVNNAGAFALGRLADTSPATWDRILATNLRGPYLLARAALPALERGKGGSVLNVSSTIGLRPVPGYAAYCVSKAGLDMLTRVLAVECAPRGVRANSIVLGIVDTPIHGARRLKDLPGWKKAAASLHPLGRLGTPEDAAEAAVYLASDAASWTTGALLVVDGGISLA